MPVPTYTPLEMIDRLVSFDTTSRESNLELIDFVSAYLSEYGVESQRVYDDSGTKANLFATIGPDTEGGIVLSAHTDVVPVDGQEWDSDPFSVTMKRGRLYGRGTSDMKSFPALFLSMLPQFLAADLHIPVHLALSYDEEVGCLGAPQLIALIKSLGISPSAVIIGEPTEMKVINRHKGVFRFSTTANGLEAHSAYPDRGVSAIFHAADTIHFLNDLSKDLRTRADGIGSFDPPYHTLHVGTLSGGTAANIVPRKCTFGWEVRLIPGGDIHTLVLAPLEHYLDEEVRPLMHKISSHASIRTETVVQIPGLGPEEIPDAENLGRELSGDNGPAGAISFGTEAGLFQRAGFATFVCGPGSILQAHKPNEYIEIDQIETCKQFMERLINRLRRA